MVLFQMTDDLSGAVDGAVGDAVRNAVDGEQK